MDTQMKKGILEMCILFKLKDEPLYGYELMKSVREIFPDVYEGSVYTILRRLKTAGYTAITQKKSASGPTRKYYGITDTGQEYLRRSIEEWRTVVSGVSQFGIKFKIE
ncbi:PadR family transcriptional regulator [Sporolactobacillus terrae]|uniref:Transcriptional regulator n=1 Tax=Sporolactobacillus terrae TaxID=269673 RepID=A0A410D837_9BACL|nr:PadR family transcriptional regulator [Sporolactobacillus terrae]QAA22292.1 PadR family transcriptional regulator [Sporolactobacillus terrae]QAA25267.1 PadR family transcriptional regulator [Sporolactobacillus terrae]UAK17081.1 PadR family transcriptional regulator [Sporolactobacillus terrae]BBN98605.1 transcriptional regulator [Sporolactobacillus terrae]